MLSTAEIGRRAMQRFTGLFQDHCQLYHVRLDITCALQTPTQVLGARDMSAGIWLAQRLAANMLMHQTCLHQLCGQAEFGKEIVYVARTLYRRTLHLLPCWGHANTLERSADVCLGAECRLFHDTGRGIVSADILCLSAQTVHHAGSHGLNNASRDALPQRTTHKGHDARVASAG